MQIENSRPRWGIVVGLFLFLGILAALPFLFYHPKNLPLYQVQNFMGPAEIYSSRVKIWAPLRRGDSLGANDKIRTGPKTEVDLGIPDQFSLRVKENSQLEVKGPRLLTKTAGYRVHLVRGSLVGSTQKDYSGAPIEISTPTLVAAFESPMFHMEVKPENSDSIVHVLQGSAQVRSAKSSRFVTVHSLEKTEVSRNAAPIQPVKVSREEWNQMKEAYELVRKSAAVEAKQLDLSKMAGGLFDYVFDHGTFYTPEFGHAEREFIKDKTSNKVHLKIDYDVFPTGSFVGVYIKTRNLDLAKFKGVEFQARVNPDEGYPQSMRVEFKTETGMARVFVPHDFKQSWQTYQYPLIVRQPTPIAEIALVFSNEKVGDFKKGVIYLSNFNLIAASQAAQPSANEIPALGQIKATKPARKIPAEPTKSLVS